MFSDCEAAVKSKLLESENLLCVSKSLLVKSGTRRLQSKIKSEISFLQRLLKKPREIKEEHLRSSNLFHLSAIVSCVAASQDVEEILKPVCLSSASGQTYHINVDVVADYGKTWIKVVARNPRALLQSSLGGGGYGKRTLLEQVDDLKECSNYYPYLYQRPAIKIWFAAGVDTKVKQLLEKVNVCCVGTVVEGFANELEDSDESSYEESDDFDSDTELPSPIYLRSVDCDGKNVSSISRLENEQRNTGKKKTILSLEEIPANATLNLDVSTLIAQVSVLTNGRCHFEYQEEILAEQARRERIAPVRVVLDTLFKGRKLVCCETAFRDFEEILGTVGGPSEKERAKEFLPLVSVVPDQPSSSAVALNVSSRVKTRSRIVFGTGESLRAVTVTANHGFLRAAQAQGFQFVSFLHESRALTELKEKNARCLLSEPDE